MKEFKKTISVILALMIAFSMFSTCISVSAAEVGETTGTGGKLGTITVNSNVANPVTLDYYSYNDSVTVTYELQSNHYIVDTQAYVDYDSAVLELGSADVETNLPRLSGGSAEMNTSILGKVYINASKYTFFNFKTSKVYYTQTFNIIGSGNTTVNLQMEVLTGSDQEDYSDATNENDIVLVNSTTVASDEFTFTAGATLSGTPVISNGFYLIKPDWTTNSLAGKFEANPNAQGEYMLSTTLAQGDKIKVARVENNAITAWYPDGTGNEYTVTAANAGTVTMYFQETYKNDWADFGGHFFIEVAQPATEEPTTAPVIADGIYLIGPEWTVSDIDATRKFEANPATQGEYMLSTTLAENDKIKVAKVQNGAITVWYPDGMNNEYNVDASHDGNVTIYFKEDYQNAWSEFGGYFYIEAEEPVTVEPTTEPATQPTTAAITEPVSGDTTIKLVVPNNINSAYAWNDARLYYNTTGKSADNQYINMTATDETYYMTELGSGISSIANAGAWKVFTVTVTEQQAAVIDNAQWVGFNNGNNRNRTVFEKAKNIFKAGVGAFDASYSNSKASIGSFHGCTFVIKDNNSTSSPYSSFLGYWTSDFTTVMMAAPMSDNSYSNWNEVSLSYGQSGDSETAIPMFNTGNTTKVSDIGDMSTLRTGRWYIYAVTLDAAQTAAVNSAARVGFVKPTGNNRTAGSKNVLKAKTNSFDGNYNSTARTLEELEGQLFVVKAKASANSVVIYNGEWQTEDVYTAGNNDTVTIYFAAPKGADKTTAGWDTGVQLYYGTTTAYQNCTKVDMTPVNTTRNVSVAGTGLTTLKSGNWDVYAIELDAQMISTIDAATTVGFIKKGSYNRTSALYTKNIAKAPTTDDGTYTKNKQSIETFDGKVFVINTCADSKNERTSYMGIWS